MFLQFQAQNAAPQPLNRIQLVFIALLLSVPFLLPFHRYTQPTFWQEWAAIVLLIGAMGTAALTFTRTQLVVPRFAIVAAFFTLVIAASSFRVGILYPEHVWIPAVFFALGLCAYRLGQQLRDTPPRWVMWAVLIGLGIASAGNLVLSFMQANGMDIVALSVVPRSNQNLRVDGFISQSNHLAALWSITILAMIAAAMWLRLTLILVVPATFIICVALAMTGSRAPFVFAVVCAVVGMWVSSPMRNKLGWRWYLPLMFLPMLIITQPVAEGLMQLWSGSMQNVWDRQMAYGAGTRTALWKDALSILMQHPLFGSGWGRMAIEQLHLGPLRVSGEIGTNAHFMPLHLTTELGLIGAAVLLVVLIPWLKDMLAGALVLKNDAQEQTATDDASSDQSLATSTANPVVGWIFLLVFVLLGVHTALEYPLYYTYYFFPFCIAAGAVDRRVWVTQWPAAAQWLKPLFCLLALTLTLWTGGKYWKVEQAYLGLSELNSPNYPTEQRINELRDTTPFPLYADMVYALWNEDRNLVANQANYERSFKLMHQLPNGKNIGRFIEYAVLYGDHDRASRYLLLLYGFDRASFDGSRKWLKENSQHPQIKKFIEERLNEKALERVAQPKKK